MNKKWWKSKTLWINGLVIIGSIYSGITGDDWFDGEMQLIILAIVDIILRRLTDTGLET